MTPSGARLIVVATAASCALVALALPIPVEPAELPALVVSARRESGSLAEYRRRAARAPTGPEVVALERALAEENRAEVGRGETPAETRTRHLAIAAARDAVRAKHGEGALSALRAKATVAADDAFRGRLDREAIDASLGGFGSVLAAYDAADERERRVLAPMFVVRTLYAARWNAQVGLPALSGLDREERRAYWGWLALEAEHAPLSLRIDALEGYGRVGGPGYEEAKATYLFRVGRYPEASEAFARLYERTGELRFRNHALAASLVAESP